MNLPTRLPEKHTSLLKAAGSKGEKGSFYSQRQGKEGIELFLCVASGWDFLYFTKYVWTRNGCMWQIVIVELE